jgi:predicted ATPase/DNA-binding winged helix-turn-helix (wHTH) protein
VEPDISKINEHRRTSRDREVRSKITPLGMLNEPKNAAFILGSRTFTRRTPPTPVKVCLHSVRNCQAAMIEPVALTQSVVSFGPFTLDMSRRLLMKDGGPVALAARTFDTLVALVSRAGQPVSKRDLLTDVWPDVTVDEGTLRFHIAALRKALGDGKDGTRYVATLAGRGYCFVALVARLHDESHERAMAPASFSHANLPSRLNRMVGRDADIARLSELLTATRFVSIVGTGGVGKTTVAVAVGHHLMEAFSGAVTFVDLGMLSDPGLVATAAASILGLSVQSDDPTPSLIAWLRNKHILLILDTCEHLIEAVAALASQIFMASPNVHILATTREALQVEDEHVYRLSTLTCPPDETHVTAANVRAFPAAQLFIERAAASGAHLELSDGDAVIVGEICRKLDGVALAIELAARRVDAYGLQETAALLDKRLTLLWTGPRTAAPRQKTLQATLDWSYGLLTNLERLVLRRLAVFVGHFTLDAVLEVMSSASVSGSAAVGAMDSLVAKSMVATRPIGAMVRYRLLDTTRAYAFEIGIDDAELTDLSARHARYYQRWLEQNGNEWSSVPTEGERSAHFAALNNVRAALEWCFGNNGDAAIGIGLAAVAVPVFLVMSLLPECHRWAERALRALDDQSRGRVEEMHLQACLGTASLYMHGQNRAAREALLKSLFIADARDDRLSRVGLRSLLHMFHFRGGEFNTAMQHATQCRAIAATVEDPAAMLVAHSILGRSLHMAGEHAAARDELETLMARRALTWRASTLYLGYDRHYRAEIALARTLWLQGYSEQAVQRVRDTLTEAKHLDRPEALSVVLAWAASVFLWTGDLASAEEQVGESLVHAESQSLVPLIVLDQARNAELAIRRGNAAFGVESLAASLEKIEAMNYGLLRTELKLSLIQGLATLGRLSQAIALVEEAIGAAKTQGDLVYMPELLRVKAGLQPEDSDARRSLAQSLELSRRQGARAWELRAATDLAARFNTQGRAEEASAVLQPVYDQFTEGAETADLKVAARTLKA